MPRPPVPPAIFYDQWNGCVVPLTERQPTIQQHSPDQRDAEGKHIPRYVEYVPLPDEPND